MSDLIVEHQDHICLITLNRLDKHNAFDEVLLAQMQQQFDAAIESNKVKVIVLKANGKHFCAGADLSWMQKMVAYDMEDNVKDAMVLANLLSTIHHSPKPIIAMVQGSAYGGGAGLVAACDIAIASSKASFCFSEIKLGLIPAVISPYVLKAMGERQAKALFLSAEVFDAQSALNLNLIHHIESEDSLLDYTLNYAHNISRFNAEALRKCKALTNDVANKPINDELLQYTARLIAQQRVSAEGQQGLKAFLTRGI